MTSTVSGGQQDCDAAQREMSGVHSTSDVEVVERQDRTLIILNSPVLGATHDKSRHRLVFSAYASASASSVPVSVTYL